MAQAEAAVDLALILAFDGSASVTFESFNLIAGGTAAALRDPSVAAGLIQGPRGASLCALLLWSASDQQEVLVDWTRVDSPASVEAFAQLVENVPRVIPAGTTAIGAALSACEAMLDAALFRASRRVIDIAGDGRSNDGPPPAPLRDRLVEAGVVINGLCILHEEPDLLESYTRDVIGGVGSFALVCPSYGEFEVAMRQKLRQEIA